MSHLHSPLRLSLWITGREEETQKALGSISSTYALGRVSQPRCVSNELWQKTDLVTAHELAVAVKSWLVTYIVRSCRVSNNQPLGIFYHCSKGTFLWDSGGLEDCIILSTFDSPFIPIPVGVKYWLCPLTIGIYVYVYTYHFQPGPKVKQHNQIPTKKPGLQDIIKIVIPKNQVTLERLGKAPPLRKFSGHEFARWLTQTQFNL